ncbi:MAG: hypothetical protein JXR59_08375 [Desulfuromonadaceae bacterium]|nr:hypothetical protein [Desulfuromonadaceae bacterium]
MAAEFSERLNFIAVVGKQFVAAGYHEPLHMVKNSLQALANVPRGDRLGDRQAIFLTSSVCI